MSAPVVTAILLISSFRIKLALCEEVAGFGVDATFVGNPLLDKLEINKKHKIQDLKNKTVALMPGSREAEMKSLWQPMQEIAIALKKKNPELKFVAVAVNNERRKLLESLQLPGFQCEYVIDSVWKTG